MASKEKMPAPLWELVQRRAKYALFFWLILATSANSLSSADKDWMCPLRSETPENNCEESSSELIPAAPQLLRRGVRQTPTASHHPPIPARSRSLDASCHRLADQRSSWLPHVNSSPLRC